MKTTTLRRTGALLASATLLASLAVTAVVAPATATPPERNVSEYEQDWEVYSPCEDEDPIHFEGWTRLREILRPGVSRITTVTHWITGPEPWSGRGTDTGVERDKWDGGEHASFTILVTNAETRQKFKFYLTGRGRVDLTNGAKCIRP